MPPRAQNDDEQEKRVDFAAMLELLKRNTGPEEAEHESVVAAEKDGTEEEEVVIMTKRDIVDDIIVEEDEEGNEDEDGKPRADEDTESKSSSSAAGKGNQAEEEIPKDEKTPKDEEAPKDEETSKDEDTPNAEETPKDEKKEEVSTTVVEAADEKLEDPEEVEVDESEKKSGTCDDCKVEPDEPSAPMELSETTREVTKTQESLDKPDERLQQRLSFAAEEQEDEMEVHEVADFVDDGEIVKKEEGEEEDKIGKPESVSEDEGVQMRGEVDDDGKDDLLEPSAAPDVGMDPRMSIVDLEESLKKELAGRKVVGMTLDDANKPTSTNGAATAATAANSTGATDATAKKKKKGCCVIS